MTAISNYLTAATPLPQYLPYARFLLDTDLSHTAKLLYTLLLDRATLSQKNNWIDAQDRIFVVYPLSSLAKDLGYSISSITRAFAELENAQLVERVRNGFSKPSRILLKVPHTTQNCAVTVCKNAEDDCAEMSSTIAQKCTPNQRNKNNLKDNHLIRTTDAHLTFGEYLINGAVETECPQLRIIEPELFEQAQELRQARTCERGSTPLGTSSKALLTGLVYCGHCGNRLSLTSSGRTHTYADGHTVKEVRPRYSCFYKIRHPGDCDGQSGYGVSKLDSIVEEVVRQIFAQFREVSRKKLLESVKTNDAARIQKKVKKIQKDLESQQKELDDLKAETILVIRGVSALDKELLGTLVAEAREALETLEKQLVQAQEEYEEATKTAKRSNYICNELFTWADVYDTANHDERRAILQQFIKEISRPKRL